MTRYWKAIISAVGLLTVVLTSLDAAWGESPDWVPVALAVLTAVGVYLKANDPPSDAPADPNVSERG